MQVFCVNVDVSTLTQAKADEYMTKVKDCVRMAFREKNLDPVILVMPMNVQVSVIDLDPCPGVEKGKPLQITAEMMRSF